MRALLLPLYLSDYPPSFLAVQCKDNSTFPTQGLLEAAAAGAITLRMNLKRSSLLHKDLAFLFQGPKQGGFQKPCFVDFCLMLMWYFGTPET